MKHFHLFIFIIIVAPVMSQAQIGPMEIIDTGSQSAGISKIVSADLDQNGFNDIIASFAGSNGKLGYYLNIDGSNFSSFQFIDAVPSSESVATGDFNNDSWIDLLMISGFNSSASAYLYWNNNGTFSGPVTVDSNISISMQGVEIADFDSNGSDDLVIIGQHSIDYYRNDGTGNFTKEHILTTSTSLPEVLECLDLATADFNADGHLDLVCAETAGLVVYINSGTGDFTPHYYSNVSEIGLLVHPFDMDADGDTDVLMQNSFGEKKWYRNDGSGTMSFEANLTIAPDLHSYISIDYNNDGLEDIYASYLNHISVFLNDANHTFSAEISIVQDNNLYMDKLALIDIDNDGLKDYVWSGMTNTLAYHLNTNNLAIEETQNLLFQIYPNPTKGTVFVNADFADSFSLKLYNLRGEMIYQNQKPNSDRSVDLSHLPSGIYFVELTAKGKHYTEKLMVE